MKLWATHGRLTQGRSFVSTATALVSVPNSDTTAVTNDGMQGIWRTYDGTANNLDHPTWGSANVALLRKSSSNYADGISTLAVRAPNNPDPRIVSNNICKETVETPNSMNLSNMVWVWGQFLDHEIDLTEPDTTEPANMTTPSVVADPQEDYPGRTILFNRSEHISGTNPREQPNTISSYIDGTNVYGFSSSRANALRLLDGTGKLRTTTADNDEVILPYNTFGLTNAQPTGSDPADFFAAGDIRANENVVLTSMHTLFVREHNRLCDVILANNPSLSGQDETIFQHARAIVVGIMQQVTYNEFLPALLGTFPVYTAYDSSANAGIDIEFSTAGYRLGHTMIPSQIQIGDNPATNILLKDAFFTPSYVQTNGVNNLLLGAAKRIMNQIDGKVVEDLRSFLFGSPTMSNLLDLASINIQRGRDHGLPGYNAVRLAYGLSTVTDFLGFETASRTQLQTLYGIPDNIDPWIGALTETHLSGKAVGPLLNAILTDQFTRLRDGDRFWFENDPELSTDEISVIKNTKLSDVLLRNSNISSSELQVDIFHV